MASSIISTTWSLKSRLDYFLKKETQNRSYRFDAEITKAINEFHPWRGTNQVRMGPNTADLFYWAMSVCVTCCFAVRPLPFLGLHPAGQLINKEKWGTPFCEAHPENPLAGDSLGPQILCCHPSLQGNSWGIQVLGCFITQMVPLDIKGYQLWTNTNVYCSIDKESTFTAVRASLIYKYLSTLIIKGLCIKRGGLLHRAASRMRALVSCFRTPYAGKAGSRNASLGEEMVTERK